jgi:hypothetical protein
MKRSDHQPHRCIDVTQVFALPKEEAYQRAADCPLCIELVDFIIRNRTAASLGEKRGRLNVIAEADLVNVLDKRNLPSQNRVMWSFEDVVRRTIAELKGGQQMELTSMGELLEARYPYAFEEIVSAVKRGASFKYIIASDKYNKRKADVEIVQATRKGALGSECPETSIDVKYRNLSLQNRKEVVYFDENGNIVDRVYELSYRPGKSVNNVRRLWVRLENEQREEVLDNINKAVTRVDKG